MRRSRRPAVRRLLLAAGLFAPAGCAPTINFPEPYGPRFDGRYAPPPVRPSDAPGDDARPVRVVTFNIKLGREIDRAIEVLRGPDLRAADVIALQEMNKSGVEKIAAELALNYVFFPASIHPAAQGYFGPAILTRWPIDSAWKVVLPHPGKARGNLRTATAAIVRVDDRPVRIYAIHLETQTQVSRARHREQVETILADAAGAQEAVVLAGDFNSEEIGRFLILKGYQWPTRHVGPTIWFFSWDHIFTKGFLPAGTRLAGAVREVRGASDHRPVWAALRLGPEAASATSPPDLR